MSNADLLAQADAFSSPDAPDEQLTWYALLIRRLARALREQTRLAGGGEQHLIRHDCHEQALTPTETEK